MRRNILLLASLPIMLASLSFDATANAPKVPGNPQTCGAAVKSSQEAIDKADWIVEGDIETVATFPEEGTRVTLVFSNGDAIKGGWPGRKGGTGTVAIGPCFPQGETAFRGTAAEARLVGKRMRIFGSKHLVDPSRRAFYIEPASVKMIAVPKPSVTYTTKVHSLAAAKPLGDGWHRARSTEGAYSIDMPGPYEDLTAVMHGTVNFMLRVKDANGVSFIAVREPNSPEASLAGTFEREMQGKDVKVLQFKGVPAIPARSVKGDLILNSLMFRVPGGTYMLLVATTKEREDASIALRERFYNSLAFD